MLNAIVERTVARLAESPGFIDRVAVCVEAQRLDDAAVQGAPSVEALQVAVDQVLQAGLLESHLNADRVMGELTSTLAQRLVTTPVLFGGEWDRVELGEGVQLVNTLMNVSSGCIAIGDQTFFGHNVSLITGTHPLTQTMSARHDYPRDGRDIVIGKGVWIASNAIVAGPCVIGDHAVIAAGAVVTCGEVESGWLYGGVPARKIRKLV